MRDSHTNKANLSDKVQVFANLKPNLQTEVKSNDKDFTRMISNRAAWKLIFLLLRYNF